MNHSEATTTRFPENPVSIYDRFTSLYDLTFRINGYGYSDERYLRARRLPLLRVLDRPAKITAVDLSARSLQTARRAVEKSDYSARHTISFVRANVLGLPFPDDSFDFVVTSGVLEYVPLQEGMRELARVL